MVKRYRKAKAEIAASSADAEALSNALAVIDKLQRENARLQMKLVETERHSAWSEGRRGDGIDRVPGYTVTETRVLRILASTGEIRYGRFDAIQRHMSNIRKKLPPGIKIKTIVMQGYEVVTGISHIRRMLAGEQAYPVRALDGVGETLRIAA